MSDLLDSFKNKKIISFEDLKIIDDQYKIDGPVDVLVIHEVLKASLKLPYLLQNPLGVLRAGTILIIKGDVSQHLPPSEYIRLRSLLLQDRRFDFLEWDHSIPASVFRFSKDIMEAPICIERAPGYPLRYQVVDRIYRLLQRTRIMKLISIVLTTVRSKKR